MSQDMTNDVIAIKEWLAKEAHLPKDLCEEEIMLRKFIHSCYGSLEKTKKCIDRFCSTRSMMPEAYTRRDPSLPSLKTAFDITRVTAYKAGQYELLIYQLSDPNIDKLVFFDLIKSFGIQADIWLKFQDFFPEGHIIVFDLKNITLRIIPKVNIMFFRDFILYLLEGMPVRVKQVHVINSPSYYETLYALIRPVIPAEICKIMNFHEGVEDLHKYINSKYLPKDFGGEALTIQENQDNWQRTIYKNREMLLDDSMWKADLKKKSKNGVQQQMSGSFKTLSID